MTTQTRTLSLLTPSGRLTLGSYLGALYSPLIVSAALASAIEYLIDLVAFLLGGARGPVPRPGPTLRKD